MNAVNNILNKIKIQPDIWFFFLFLLTFTLTIRKVLFYFPIKGTFNEYSGIYIYISDIFLILTLFFWFLPILNNISHVSSIDNLWITCKKHNLSTLSRTLRDNLIIFTPLFFALFAFLSILWSNNKLAASYRSFKLLEFYLLYIYIIFRFIPLLVTDRMFHVEQNTPISFKSRVLEVENVPRGTLVHIRQLIKKSIIKLFRLQCSTWNIFVAVIVLVGAIQSIIGILQVIWQHSVGVFWLKESVISPDIPGVAKLVIHGHKYIRAYGLFPHPNILGGFLIMSIILTWLCIRMFHVEHSNKSNKKIVPRGTLLVYITLAIQLLALILTFSKSAILGLIIAGLYIYVPRGTFASIFDRQKDTTKCSTFTPCEQSEFTGWNIFNRKRLILVSLILLTLIYLFSLDLVANLEKSIEERLTYVNVSRGTIFANPWFGVGQGQFVWDMQKYSPRTLEVWQYQPVHTIPLLIWSELGIVGLALFCFFIYNVFQPLKDDFVPCGTKSSYEPSVEQVKEKNVPRLPRRMFHVEHFLKGGTYMKQEYIKYFQATLLGFIFIMFWDHYSWDIQQGQAALWLVLGFVVGLKSVGDDV